MSPILIRNTKSFYSSNKLIYLDRDGVLLEPVMRGNNVSSARCIDEIKICSDAAYFCEKLNSAGYSLIVISNQPDIGRGLIDLDFIYQTNKIISKNIDIDFYLYCPHQHFEECICRKPKPGMINYFRATFCPKPTREIMVGDRVIDYDCAVAADIEFFLKCQPYTFFGDGKRLMNYKFSFNNLIDAIDEI